MSPRLQNVSLRPINFMTKTKQKITQLDAVDRIGIAMLAPARATVARIGLNEFTAKLGSAIGRPISTWNVSQWLGTDAATFRHPRAGVAKLMLDIK